MVNDLIDLFFPRYCLLSQEPLSKGEKFISVEAFAQLPVIPAKEDFTYYYFGGKLPIASTCAFWYFWKNSGVQTLMHHIKYKNHTELAFWVGQQMGWHFFETHLNKVDYIIPLPLHRKRLKKRGYNQSQYIAEGMASVLNKKMLTNVINRRHEAISQTKMHNREARFQNIKDVFSVENPELIKDMKVLLIDDTITTGATTEACCLKIFESNPKEVHVAALAAAVS